MGPGTHVYVPALPEQSLRGRKIRELKGKERMWGDRKENGDPGGKVGEQKRW